VADIAIGAIKGAIAVLPSTSFPALCSGNITDAETNIIKMYNQLAASNFVTNNAGLVTGLGYL
jgi:hypothetical protein